MRGRPLVSALLVAAGLLAAGTPARASDLAPLAAFGSNPGSLEGFAAVPPAPPAGAPLVVVLHGCLQQAADVHARSGLAELADELQLYLLYPQQPTSNNSMSCFNWFLPEDQARDGGELLSITQMVDRMLADHAIDPARVFVLGISAGAAAAANLLAAWPEKFAAGALMAGIPARCAGSLSGAQACQAGTVDHAPQEWADLVRQASPAFTGAYPRVALFHGTADTIVAPANLAELAQQWTAVHGIAASPTATDTLNGHAHARYDRDGTTVVETFAVAGMGHGMAVGAADPRRPCGQAGTWFEDRGLCAAWWSLRFFGLATPPADGGVAGDGGPTGDGGATGDGGHGADGGAAAPESGGCAIGGGGAGSGGGAVGGGSAARLALGLALGAALGLALRRRRDRAWQASRRDAD